MIGNSSALLEYCRVYQTTSFLQHNPKPELVERLLQVEQAYAELAEVQAQLQFKWMELEL
jgi:hypothetical protein